MDSSISLIRFIEELQEARRRTLALIADLDDEQMIGPRLAIVNPLRWEIGHVAWFQEYWVLRHLCGRPPIRADGDALYDSTNVAHETRWDLPLPSRAETMTYMQKVLDQVLDHYDRRKSGSRALGCTVDPAYFLSLVLLHEDMHAEAIAYTRQTLGYPAPHLSVVDEKFHTKAVDEKRASSLAPAMDGLGDALIPGGKFLVGSTQAQPFVFDNEMAEHEVYLQPFSLSRTAVTNAEYAAFVSDRAYQRRELWSDDGWDWRESVDANHPVY